MASLSRDYGLNTRIRFWACAARAGMEVISLSKMMRLTLPKSLSNWGAARRRWLPCWRCVRFRTPGRRRPPPPQGVSRGENFSAKPPAQLFASDCTGAGCHKGPQGLGKKANGIGGLAGFLREHYTNSRESAAALANYLTKLPSGPEPKEPKEARSPEPGKPATAAAPASGPPNWFESTSARASLARPSRASRTRPPTRRPAGARTRRPSLSRREAGCRGEARGAAGGGACRAAAEAGGEAAGSLRPSRRKRAVRPARATRGRHPAAAANAAAPAAVPEPEPAPPPSPPPAPKQYDIFD